MIGFFDDYFRYGILVFFCCLLLVVLWDGLWVMSDLTGFFLKEARGGLISRHVIFCLDENGEEKLLLVVLWDGLWATDEGFFDN